MVFEVGLRSLKSVWVLMVCEMPSNNCVNSRLVALDLSYNELGGLLPEFMGAREREMMSLWCEREREVRERHERKESVSFYEYNSHLDCYSGALYIRLYYSILLFRDLYRESVVGLFLRFFGTILYT